MDVLLGLEAQLIDDARREIPPFGAESAHLARSIGAAATPILMKQIDQAEAPAFLALEALHGADPKAYSALSAETKGKIYVRTLSKNIFYNAWGIPGHYLTDTAKHLIGLGKQILPFLLPLLQERRAAPLSGSQDATTSQMYGNRLCDYAWVFMNEILDRRYTYPRAPAERDPLIAALHRELAHGSK